MYVIIATLDKKTESLIRQLQQGLVKKGLVDSSDVFKDKTPHVTIADFECDEVTGVIELLETNEIMDKPFEISFNSIGSFIGSDNIFLSPVQSDSLQSLHNDIHDLLKDYITSGSLCSIDKWIPHMTIVSKIGLANLNKIYRYCIENLDSIEGKVVGIQLIKVGTDRYECIYKKNFVEEF